MKGSESMTAAQQVFELMCRFHHLRLPERIGMLPRAEHIVLEMLLSNETKGGTTLNAACMARRMHISAPAVSRTMRRLRERGYIIVDHDPADRRFLRAQITPSGRSRLESDRRKMNALIDSAVARLGPGEAEQFFKTFDRLCTGIEEEIERLFG